MAQPQQNLTIAAPGFAGVNTQDSPITQGPEFAATADNCVIDKYGRVGARKGYTVLTTDNTDLGTDSVSVIHEFIALDGTKTVFSAGNNKIFSGTTTITDITPGSYTISADDWQIVTLNDDCFFFQRAHEPLVYDASAATLAKMSLHANYGATTAPQCHAAVAAYGRIWCADLTADKSTIYWSGSLIGPDFDGAGSGSLDITEVWPTGHDEIVALAAHNNYLLIFGRESIIVYGSSHASGRIATPSADLKLEDTITGIGCVSRHTIKSVGSDLLFLDYSGVRSFARVIQEKSLPIGDISKNVRNDIKDSVAANTGIIYSEFSPDESFYIVGFPTSLKVYCFDMRGMLEDGSARTTTWSGVSYTSAEKLQDGTVYLGTTDGICKYTGYQDDGSAFLMSYYSNPLTFDAPSTLKIPKQVDATIIGGEGGTATLKWAYDYKTNYSSQSFSIGATALTYYGVAEYGEDEYSLSNSLTSKKINVTGSGTSFTVGFEASINGSALSVQEFNIQALVGRTI